MKTILILLVLMQEVAALAQSAKLEEKSTDVKKPNIVFILMDNLGYGEVGC